MDTITSKTTLKGWFVSGAKPTESQFNDLITTFVSLSGDQSINGNLTATKFAGNAAELKVPVARYDWTGNYFNLSNSTDNIVRFTNEIFNSDSSVYQLVNSNSDTARVGIRDTGYFEFTSQVHTYDLYSNVDVLVKLMSASTSNGAMSLVSLFNDNRFSETSDDQLLNGTIIVKVESTGYYGVAINPSANSPYPSSANSTPTRLFIKKVSAL